MTVQEKPPRKSGIAHFFAAAGYSLGGLKRLARESAFRQELLLAALMAPWAFVVDFNTEERILLLGALILVLVMICGRLGPLTLAFMLARPVETRIKYPEETVYTG